MSYQALIVAWHGAPMGSRCVNPYDPQAEYPEHREDEHRLVDAIFDVHPDDFGAHPLAPLDRQLFEDCRKVQGKVVGRHDAIVRTPWYLTSQYLRGKLGCSVADLEERSVMVVSAGTSATPGGRAAEEAIAVMRERGLDLTGHESQPLDERLVTFADVIITMTRSHRDAIVSVYPQAASRTFVLSRGRGDVSDPIGGPPEQYRRCAEQIDAYLAEWVDEIDLERE